VSGDCLGSSAGGEPWAGMSLVCETRNASVAQEGQTARRLEGAHEPH
jgi:hypothetical protein